MKYIELHNNFHKKWYFSLNEVNIVDQGFRIANIYDRIDKWYITSISKWRYIFSDIYIDESLLMQIANNIYTPSYISLEYAMRYYNLIPEWVFIMTSISTAKTQTLRWNIWTFRYNHITPKLFRWYILVKYADKYIYIAEPEKLICDRFYFKNDKSYQDFENLRIDIDELKSIIDIPKLEKYANIYPKTVSQTIYLFIKYISEYDQY